MENLVWDYQITKDLKQLYRISNPEPISIIWMNVRWEIEAKPFLGKEGGWVAMMWQCSGTKRIHCYTIEYGQTEDEAIEKIQQGILAKSSKPQ